jgi:UrcA family protein
MKTIIAMSAAALIAGVATQAVAQDLGDARTVAVSYGDLDLTRASGREVLEHRIAGAVDKVCAGRPSSVDLTMLHYYEKCRSEAFAGARQQLAQVYDGRALAQASIKVGPGKR